MQDDSSKVLSIIFRASKLNINALKEIVRFLSKNKHYLNIEKKGFLDYDKFIKRSSDFYKTNLEKIDEKLLNSTMKKYNLSYTVQENADGTYRFLCKSIDGKVNLEKIDMALQDYEKFKIKGKKLQTFIRNIKKTKDRENIKNINNKYLEK